MLCTTVFKIEMIKIMNKAIARPHECSVFGGLCTWSDGYKQWNILVFVYLF